MTVDTGIVLKVGVSRSKKEIVATQIATTPGTPVATKPGSKILN
ncbi:MAG: hypothetical protein ACLQOO_28240 [Terriglobia bacterium]